MVGLPEKNYYLQLSQNSLLKGIAYFTSKEQRDKALPYSGFNTFTPGVSWGKVFASQREGGGGGGLSSGGGVVSSGHVF